MRPIMALWLLALAGCVVDADGDGSPYGEDCDDGDPAVYPGADEACNDLDDDCDGEVDETDPEGPEIWHADADGDGFGDPSTSARVVVVGCDPPSGAVDDDGDCDDTDAAVHPGAEEACNGVDDDCDGEADELDPDGPTTVYTDADGDGYGDPASPVVYEACDPPDGVVADASDCDDADSAVSPDADEVCFNGGDEDCDGAEDLGCDVEETADYTYRGGGAVDEYFGYRTALGVDVTGDGQGDLVIGGPSYESEDFSYWSEVVVYSGANLGGDPAFEVRGTVNLGYDVELLSDMTGDEVGELLVMGYRSLDDSTRDRSVYLAFGPVSGKTITWDWTSADRTLTILGETPLNPTTAGDLDGDGLGDLAVAAYDNEDGGRDAGAHYIVYGADVVGWDDEVDLPDEVEPILGERLDAHGTPRFGARGAGDLDGDGLDDLLIAGYHGYVVLGDTLASGLSSVADADVVVPPASTDLGLTVYLNPTWGDVDGDGSTDATISSSTETAAVIFADTLLASSALEVTDADVFLDDCEPYLVGVGDVDGLGTTDLICEMGSSVALYDGESLPVTGTLVREDARLLLSSVGWTPSFHAVGDVSGDDQADLLFGCPICEDRDGRAWLILGW